MKSDQDVLTRLQNLLKQKKSKSFYAQKLGITESEVESLLNELRGRDPVEEKWEIMVDEVDTEERVVEENLDKGTLKSILTTNFAPKSVDELYELHKIDKTRYKISSYWSKQRGDKFTSSVLASQIKPQDFSPEQFAEFLRGYKTSYKPELKEKRTNKESVEIVLSLADFHLDKLDIVPESIEEKKAIYINTMRELVGRVTDSFSIDKIVFVLGNDLLHTDTFQGTTTSGTPVENSITWNKAYEEAFDLMVNAIIELSGKCQVLQIVLVQGNHARTKEYYLAHALEKYFRYDRSIVFDREFTNMKHVTLGSTFIGFHHGNTKIDDLPLLFATSQGSSSDFGNSEFRHIITGDKHYYLAKEIRGVRVQQMPSLSGTDRWHQDNNFVNSVRSGLVLVYHPSNGKIAEFESILRK